MTRHRLALIAPVHNEEGNLGPFFQRASASAATLGEPVDTRFVFVDDGSTDGSLQVLESLAARDERVVVIRLVRNWGSHAAIKAALTTVEADFYVALSVDLQDPPELIAGFYAKAEADRTDVVWGVRASRDDPALKKLFASAFYSVIRAIALPNLPKVGVDTFLISRRVRDDYLSIRERDTMPYYLMMWLGYPQSFLPYHRAARHSGTSKWTLRKRFKNAFDSILSFSSLPIRMITYVGILLFLGAGVLATILVINKIFGYPAPGWTGTALLVTVAMGVQTLMLAIIAQYVWRIGEVVRGRPEFLVDRVIGGGDAASPPPPEAQTDAPRERRRKA
ncbi:MAG: glycosyltransferase family 2 protein [Deltaproteobacteria bacterium]|nr:MAG: glycosyltransferase family 2 protein [Deltaproteobacteria bacterium]